MATFSAAVTTTTREYIVPKVYDQVTTGAPGIMKFLQTSESWKGGTKYDFPIQYKKSTQVGNVGIADKLSTTRENTRVKASFEIKMATAPVVVAAAELAVNNSDERVVDLLTEEFDEQSRNVMGQMSENLYGGTGVGDDWDSLANAADDGTVYSTYGTLSRTTYTAWAGYYLASTGAITLAKFATADDAVMAGSDSADMIFTTKSIWSTYESLLTSTVRANYVTSGYPRMNAFGMVGSMESQGMGQGFDVIFFRGKPVIRDEFVPSGEVFFVNSKNFGFKGLDMSKGDKNIIGSANFKKTGEASGTPKGTIGNVPSTYGFNYRELMSPVDQLVQVGHVIIAGNFIATQSRLQGHMVGAS